jgi:hypothetical protein
MARILPRRHRWTIEHWDHCVRTWDGVRSSRGRPIWREHCSARSTPPPGLQAADGYRISFPRRIRRSDAYENAIEVIADVWLDTGAESDVEPGFDGEIDPAEISGYNYSVDVNIRSADSMSLVSWRDLVSHPRVGLEVSVAGQLASAALPSGMAAEQRFSVDLPNDRRVEFSVLLPDTDGSW